MKKYIVQEHEGHKWQDYGEKTEIYDVWYYDSSRSAKADYRDDHTSNQTCSEAQDTTPSLILGTMFRDQEFSI
jgi:hypothetical protein